MKIWPNQVVAENCCFDFVRFCVFFLVFFIISSPSIAQNELAGLYYSPSLTGGCHQEGRVIQIKNDNIYLFENGKKIPWITEIVVQKIDDTLSIEGKPSGNALVSRAFKKVFLKYVIEEESLVPVGAKFDEVLVDLSDPNSKVALESYALTPCHNSTFATWIAMKLGIYTEFLSSD